MTDAEVEVLVDELEVRLLEMEVRLLRKMHNMLYSWGMWIVSEDGVTPTFEEAVSD